MNAFCAENGKSLDPVRQPPTSATVHNWWYSRQPLALSASNLGVRRFYDVCPCVGSGVAVGSGFADAAMPRPTRPEPQPQTAPYSKPPQNLPRVLTKELSQWPFAASHDIDGPLADALKAARESNSANPLQYIGGYLLGVHQLNNPEQEPPPPVASNKDWVQEMQGRLEALLGKGKCTPAMLKRLQQTANARRNAERTQRQRQQRDQLVAKEQRQRLDKYRDGAKHTRSPQAPFPPLEWQLSANVDEPRIYDLNSSPPPPRPPGGAAQQQQQPPRPSSGSRSQPALLRPGSAARPPKANLMPEKRCGSAGGTRGLGTAASTSSLMMARPQGGGGGGGRSSPTRGGSRPSSGAANRPSSAHPGSRPRSAGFMPSRMQNLEQQPASPLVRLLNNSPLWQPPAATTPSSPNSRSNNQSSSAGHVGGTPSPGSRPRSAPAKPKVAREVVFEKAPAPAPTAAVAGSPSAAAGSAVGAIRAMREQPPAASEEVNNSVELRPSASMPSVGPRKKDADERPQSPAAAVWAKIHPAAVWAKKSAGKARQRAKNASEAMAAAAPQAAQAPAASPSHKDLAAQLAAAEARKAAAVVPTGGSKASTPAAAKPTPERKVEYAETVEEEAHLIKPRREGDLAVVSIQVMSGRARVVIGAVGGGGAAAAAEEGEAHSPTTGVLMGELSEYMQHASTPPKAGPPKAKPRVHVVPAAAGVEVKVA